MGLIKLMKEIWKNIIEWEGCYKISNLGRVKSLVRKGVTKEKILKPLKIGPNKNYFYLHVILCNKINGRVDKRISIHRLVCMAFIPNPLNKPHINHKDNNPLNNNVNNLEWCTPKENTQHAAKQKRMGKSFGEKQHSSKLKEFQVIEIRKLKGKMSQQKIAEKYNVKQVAIGRILSGIRWKHLLI